MRAHTSSVLILFLSFALAGSSAAQCFSNSKREFQQDGKWLWGGFVEAPRNAIRPHNLKWELPIAGVTAALIASGDTPASRLITSPSLQRNATRASNIGLGIELGAAGAAYALGCGKHRDGLRSTGQAAFEAAGAAMLLDEMIKRATNRQRPPADNSRGEFWEGGSSFASGHATTSFAIASVIAHRTHNRWAKWGVYALAAGVSLARYPAKEHFFSDIVIGGTLGYVTGTYLAEPHPGMR